MQPLKLIFSLCIIATVASPSAMAQSIVEEQITEITLAHQALGFTKTHNTVFLDLNHEESDVFTIDFEKGYTYSIMAVCDGDCGDIDLCLYDGSGNTIDCDQELDDNPGISVTPLWSGEFTVLVQMHDCSSEPCRTAVLVFGQ